MENKIIAILKKQIVKHGLSLLDNPIKLSGLLKDHCGDSKKEINLILFAQKEKVPQELIKYSSQIIDAHQFQRQSSRLIDNLGLHEDSARWAVECWIKALGKEYHFTKPLKIDIKNSIPVQNIVTPQIEMILVEGGIFQMGNNNFYDDERPVHRVQLDSFYIGKYPVTQKQWIEIMGYNPSRFSKNENFPVEKIRWNEVHEFIKKLNDKSGLTYRLPTEAEWEYAAKGGKKSKGFLYSGSSNADEVGWYKGNSDGKPHPVGLKQSNEIGIYDMSGNIEEWCSDFYNPEFYKTSPFYNPQESSNSYRNYDFVAHEGVHITRGGKCSWADVTFLRISCRSYKDNSGGRDIGFRLAK